MKIDELYDYIIKTYGQCQCWISDLAKELNISYEDANYLTSLLGYSRGKLNNSTPTPLNTFCNNKRANNILSHINDQKVKTNL